MLFQIIYILILIDFTMSRLQRITRSGRRFAPNQEEHYPEMLSDTTESSASFETAPDRPPTYEEATRSGI